jgi:glycosyltransferase involved in cell wall biosynthesis
MVCEVPVISTEVAGVPELIEHQKNGLLVEQRDAHALADAMELLLGSPAARNCLARNGRETALHRFTREASARRVYSILSSVLESSRSVDVTRKQVGVSLL